MADETSTLNAEERAELNGMAQYWWLWLITGIAWLIIALIVLQFDTASVKTVGLLVGLMFLFTGVQQFILATVVEGWKWVWFLFGVLFVLAGLWALFNPGETVAALADSLGFLFLLVAIFWAIEAFATKAENELWWLSLIAAILMMVIAFWVSGQFLVERVYTLLIFAGAWALMSGIVDIIKAFQIRRVGKLIAG
ncbi:MAG: DUF308 domain-containing protein [Candidatus Nanopelagicales bacterium]